MSKVGSGGGGGGGGGPPAPPDGADALEGVGALLTSFKAWLRSTPELFHVTPKGKCFLM